MMRSLNSRLTRVFIFLQVLSTLTVCDAMAGSGPVIQTEKQKLSYQVVTDQLSHPWSLAFLPNGDMLVSERRGQLRLVKENGGLLAQPISRLSAIRPHGQGGPVDL